MSIANFIKKSLGEALEVAFPAHCLICERKIYSSSICSLCKPKIINLELNRCFSCFLPTLQSEDYKFCQACKNSKKNLINSFRYLCNYDPNTRDFLQVLKYQPSIKLCRIAAEYLINSFSKLYKDKQWDLLVPIPSSRSSIKKRGFNHVHLIASELSKKLLTRNKIILRFNNSSYNKPQAQVKKEVRSENIKNCFYTKEKVVMKKILLIDDVITTSSTTIEAAKVLKSAGASKIDCLSFAAGPNWRKYYKSHA